MRGIHSHYDADDLAALVTALHVAASRDMAGLAVSIFEHHKQHLQSCSATVVSKRLEAVIRVMRRRASECPALPKLDIPTCALRVPSFTAWVGCEPGGSQRPSPPSAGPLRFYREWRLEWVEHAGAVV